MVIETIEAPGSVSPTFAELYEQADGMLDRYLDPRAGDRRVLFVAYDRGSGSSSTA
jgi:hypothetical protein